MGTHHVTAHRVPLLWRRGTDPAWGCQCGTAGHGVLCVCVCVAMHVLCRGMEKRLSAGCDSVWGL